MKKILSILLLLLCVGVVDSFGSHLMGGEVTWVCQKSGPNAGRFKFTVKLYRDCNGITAPTTVSLQTNAPGWGAGINCPQISTLDLSPVGTAGQNPPCPTCATPGGQLNAVLECIYESSWITITGVPPATGWYFYYNDCCRNAGVTNLGTGGGGNFTLRALMFPYNATNTNPCYDSSPRFAERPQLATMIGNTTTYSSNAVDEESDSLYYEWGRPLDGTTYPGTNYPFASGYAYNNPLPSPTPPQNANNQAAVLNPNSGIVSFLSFNTGSFVTVTKVSSYRCGIKIAEVYREIQITLIANRTVAYSGGATGLNTPPDVDTSIIFTYGFQQASLNQYVDTVYAGDTVFTTIQATDFEFVGNTSSTMPQSVSFDVTGIQLDTAESFNSGRCPFPPCAYLTDVNGNGTTVPTGFGLFNNTINFNWVTSCNHLSKTVGCVRLSNTYNFVVKAFDSFCPSPAVNFFTLSIVVLAPPEMKASKLYCADVLPSGKVTLSWDIPPDTGLQDTVKYFRKHYIYRAIGAGPFALVDSDSVATHLTWTDNNVNANAGSVRYYLETKSGCDLLPRPQSDTLSTMYLQVSQVGTNASLSWTPLRTPANPIGSHPKYFIYKEQPAGSGIYNLIDSTSNTSYLDPVTVCNDSINYYIRLHNDLKGCDSRSNIDGARLTAAAPTINPPSLRCVSVLPNEDIQISWVGTPDTASYFSEYKIYHSLTKAGPYTQIGTVTNYGANTFTHVGAQGNAQPHFYYITTKAGCDATTTFDSPSTSDSLSSIKLNLSNATLGFADLNWNALRTPLPATSSGQYKVYRRVVPSLPWVLRGTTAALTFRDTITLCDTTIQYKVEIADASGCISTSSDSAKQFTSLGDILDNPSIRCLAVQPNGDVQVTWLAPADPDNFFSKYEIYSASALAGPYSLVGTVNSYGTTSWLHNGANANSGSRYYYLKTLSGCSGIADNGSTSDTLATIYLTVSNATLGSAILNWNMMSNPLIASSTGTYIIKRRTTGVGAYTQIGTTSNLNYTDNISTCNVPYEYIIEIGDNAPCTSVSSAANGIFTYQGNVIVNPDLRCVSVQTNGQILLSFVPPSGSSTNFNEYEIWRDNGTGFTKLDSVSTFGATTYLDATANGNAQPYSYYMLTQSGCTGQINSTANSQTLSSIYLTTTPALGLANLSWTALAFPIPATSTTGQYDVWSSYNAAGTLQLYGDTNKLVYSQPIFNCDTTLQHQIKLADNSGCVSTSNIYTNLYTYLGNIINNPDLRCLSVQPNGQIQLSFIQPTGSNTNFNEYEIWRDNGAGFTKLDSVSSFGANNYMDITANGNNQSYSYYMLTQSGCSGQINSTSNSQTLSSIYLTTTPVLGTANLNWSALATPIPASATTGQYDIWSSYNATGNLQLYGDTNKLVYSQPIINCDTTLRHQIKLADNSGCVSTSNIDTNLYTYLGNVINNPDLRCLSVQPNGQIQLSFIPPSGSNVNFNEFEIWRNNGAGFTKLDSVSNFAATTFTDITANGNNQSYSYYMLTQSGCSGQINSAANSQTLSSIYLSTTPALGTANLNWSALSSPIPATTTTGQYDIWSSYNLAGTLQLYGDTDKLVYSQPISNCDTSIHFQIKLADNSGCISTSNIDTNLFTYIGNIIDNPLLHCVSVASPGGQTQLTWANPTPSSWVNYNQYNIYRSTGAGFTLIDSVQNSTTTTYTDNTANGYNGSVSYYLVTKAGCSGQVDNGNLGNTISSIYLKVTGANTTNATLNWNAPSTPLLPTTNPTYLVERQQPAGSGLWTVAGNVNTTTFTEPLTLCIDSVNYRVSIQDAICTSMSNYDGETFVDHTVPKSPELRCASVLPNGDVTLTWIAPVDTGMRFGNYQIYSSSNPNGPFTKVQTVNAYSTLSYTHVGANAQNNSIYYYITTQTACGGETSPVTDTIRTIHVNVINNNGVAIIRWNPLHDPELATATLAYDVYKEYPTGTWSKIGTTNSPDYDWSDTINVCSAIINYYVTTGDQSGCTSNSSIDGDLFKDITKPNVSVMDTVSLNNPTGTNVNMSWIPSTSGDVEGYILYHFNGASWDSIGAVIGANITQFSFVDASVQSGPQLYSIAAYDSCGNRSSIGLSQNTMFLKAKLDVCKYAIDLQWNPFINMPGGVAGYNVFMSENNGPFSLIATVPSTNITYSHNTLTNGSIYNYYVQAIGNDNSKSSVSTQASDTANLLVLPTFGYLRKATVIDPRRVIVTAYVDTLNQPDVSKYKLQRAYEKTGPFSTVNVQTYNGLPDLTFADFTARTNQYSYYYRIVTVDSCGNEVLTSNLGRTILLSGLAEQNLTNNLKYNDYEEWLGGVSNYSLFRKIDDIWQPAPCAVLPFGQQAYLDDVASLYQTTGRFCYKIEAYEGAGNTYGFTDTSTSNEICLIQEPKVYIPTAFTPGGKNNLFKPSFIYVDAKNYFFIVFNRWGQKVFETHNPEEGWDGMFDGTLAPEGTYVYNVRIFGTNGQEIEKNGSVTLLR
ncbi:MAG: gliding motility-associated C-terminal domain-containing protein [Bacteroidota bacterium]